MRWPLLALVASVVLVSGCTSLPSLFGPTGVNYDNDIVVIRDLSAVPQTIGKGQTLRLIAYVQNLGDKTIAPGATGERSVDGNVVVTLYDYCEGLFTIKSSTCGGASGTDATCRIDKLLPKETRLVDWVLEPASGTRLTSKCTLKVAAQYPYTTEGLTTIGFINPAELDRQLQQGAFKAVSSTYARGYGPVKAWFDVRDQQPIPAAISGSNARTPVLLQIENFGSGFLSSDAAGSEAVIRKDKVTIDTGGLQQASDNCRWTGGHVDEDVKLIKKKAPPILCELQIPAASEVPKELTKQLKVSISYFYEFRKEAAVTVEVI